jgi:pantoate--beta-alanine ligase
MVAELNIPTRIETIETVREDDGLAMSSRNRYLSAAERAAARTLSIALDAARGSADRGIDAALAAAQGALMGEKLVELDYFAVVHPRTFLPVDDDYRGAATAIVAANLGTTRLIDNETIRLV